MKLSKFYNKTISVAYTDKRTDFFHYVQFVGFDEYGITIRYEQESFAELASVNTEIFIPYHNVLSIRQNSYYDYNDGTPVTKEIMGRIISGGKKGE